MILLTTVAYILQQKLAMEVVHDMMFTEGHMHMVSLRPTPHARLLELEEQSTLL